MKNFQPLSFGLGLASGLVILLLIAGGMRLRHPSSAGRFPTNGGAWQQRQGGGNGGPNISRMAERFGMTEEELRKELEGGKTMQDIAREKGVELPMARGGQPASTGSGTFVSSSSLSQ